MPPASVGLALSVIFGGVAAASVFGVPLGVFLGETLGWRMAFLAVAVLAALTLLLLVCVLPPLPVTQAISWRSFTAQRANRRLLTGLLRRSAGRRPLYGLHLCPPAVADGRRHREPLGGAAVVRLRRRGIFGNFIAGQAA
ncbi:MFS transporter, partial [Serratia marcescens]|uniref:MFS transporter n=1 Tax=Serratia marcescens TaxID=615 RepID=UPI002237D8BF